MKPPFCSAQVQRTLLRIDWHRGSMSPAAWDGDAMAMNTAPASAKVRQSENDIVAPNSPSLRNQNARLIAHLQLIVECRETSAASPRTRKGPARGRAFVQWM